EIDETVKSYEKIHNVDQWERENDKIEKNIQALRDKRTITTDPTQIKTLDEEIAAYERQQNALAYLAQHGLRLAQIEERRALILKEQIASLALQDQSYERQRAAAEKRAAIDRELTDERTKGKEAAVDLAHERGLIDDVQAVAAKAKIQRDADDENFNRSQRLADQKVKSIQDEIAHTKDQREEAQQNFD